MGLLQFWVGTALFSTLCWWVRYTVPKLLGQPVSHNRQIRDSRLKTQEHNNCYKYVRFIVKQKSTQPWIELGTLDTSVRVTNQCTIPSVSKYKNITFIMNTLLKISGYQFRISKIFHFGTLKIKCARTETSVF